MSNGPDARASLNLSLGDHAATERLGSVLADSIQTHAVIALIGPMGAGKTTLVQGLARALGIKETVNSPTFTMMNEYHSGRLPLYHLDLYRLSEDAQNVADLLAIELDQFIDQNVIAVIEWADSFTTNLENRSYISQLDHLVVKLDYVEEVTPAKNFPASPLEPGRKASLSALGDQSSVLILDVRKRLDGMFIYS